MKYLNVHLINIFLIMCCLACSVKQADMDVEKVKEEIRNRKIRRFTDAQIVQAAYDSGRVIVKKINLAMVDCNTKIAIDNKLVIDCFIACDSTLLDHQKEIQIWSAYQYNIANNLSLQDNIQKTSEGVLVYSLPLDFKADSTKESMTSPKVLFLRLNKKNLILNM